LQVLEDISNPGIEIGSADTAVERTDSRFVVDIDPRGASANRINLWEVRGCAAKTIGDSVAMILGVALKIRIPFDFLGEDDFAVD
jgi:hypothetical protein